MIRLHYSDGFVVTSEEVGDAVIQYAQALADEQSAEVVTIPIVDEDGAVAESTLLIGPSSQLYTTPAHVASPGLESRMVIDELRRKTEALQRPRGGAVDREAIEHLAPTDPHEM